MFQRDPETALDAIACVWRSEEACAAMAYQSLHLRAVGNAGSNLSGAGEKTGGIADSVTHQPRSIVC